MRSIASTTLLIGAISPVMSGVVQNRQSVGGVLIPGGNIKFDNCDRKPGEFCTFITMSEKTTEFGTVHPKEAAKGIEDNCMRNGCNVKAYSVDTKWGISHVGPESIEVQPHGDYSPDLWGELMDKMLEAVDSKVESYNQCEQGGAHRPGNCFKFYTAPQEYHINRYKVDDDGELLAQGEFSLSMYQEDGDSDTCENVMNALGAAFGGAGDAAGLLGLLSFACS